ncbi:MAG: hypothetical protein UC944_08295, partial [Anaerovibrio sp.]|nr:hypothetical protein [Anaerovibrio sp.]
MKNPPAFPNTDGFHGATRPIAYQLLYSHYNPYIIQRKCLCIFFQWGFDEGVDISSTLSLVQPPASYG